MALSRKLLDQFRRDLNAVRARDPERPARQTRQSFGARSFRPHNGTDFDQAGRRPSGGMRPR